MNNAECSIAEEIGSRRARRDAGGTSGVAFAAFDVEAFDIACFDVPMTRWSAPGATPRDER